MEKPSRKIQSVYRNLNALVRAVFERAGGACKVLRVALDDAKREHVALVCDGHGDVLKASFPDENNAAGIAYLINEITATARHRPPPQSFRWCFGLRLCISSHEDRLGTMQVHTNAAACSAKGSHRDQRSTKTHGNII